MKSKQHTKQELEALKIKIDDLYRYLSYSLVTNEYADEHVELAKQISDLESQYYIMVINLKQGELK